MYSRNYLGRYRQLSSFRIAKLRMMMDNIFLLLKNGGSFWLYKKAAAKSTTVLFNRSQSQTLWMLLGSDPTISCGLLIYQKRLLIGLLVIVVCVLLKNVWHFCDRQPYIKVPLCFDSFSLNFRFYCVCLFENLVNISQVFGIFQVIGCLEMILEFFKLTERVGKF